MHGAWTILESLLGVGFSWKYQNTLPTDLKQVGLPPPHHTVILKVSSCCDFSSPLQSLEGGAILSTMFSCNGVPRQAAEWKTESPVPFPLCRKALEVFPLYFIAQWRSCPPLEKVQRAHREAKGNLSPVTVSRFLSPRKKVFRSETEIQQSPQIY